MVAWIGPAISAGATLLGGLFKNKQDQKRIDEANRLSSARTAAAEAKTDERLAKQREFQERMSSTAYQRAVQDMRKAGLNPILAYKQGGASSPGGGASPGQQAAVSTHETRDVLSPAAASALAARRLTSEVENMEETNRNLQQQNRNLTAEQARIIASTRLTNMDAMVKGEILQSAKAAAAAHKTDEEFYKSPQGKFLRNLERWRGAIFGGSGSSAKVRIGR